MDGKSLCEREEKKGEKRRGEGEKRRREEEKRRKKKNKKTERAVQEMHLPLRTHSLAES